MNSVPDAAYGRKLAESQEQGYALFVMKRTFISLIIALFFAGNAAAQQSTSKDLSRAINELKLGSSISVSYDSQSDLSKVMAVVENFPQNEAERAGTQAINFAMAFTFAGKAMVKAPDSVKLTYWVLTKKPKFEADHTWLAVVSNKTVDLGEARYAAKPSENMEYLNFVLTRDDLKKIATASKFKLGRSEFTPTPRQLQILDAMYQLSNL